MGRGIKIKMIIQIKSHGDRCIRRWFTVAIAAFATGSRLLLLYVLHQQFNPLVLGFRPEPPMSHHHIPRRPGHKRQDISLGFGHESLPCRLACPGNMRGENAIGDT